MIFICGGKCCRPPILRTVQEYFWRVWQGQTQYVWQGQTTESGLRWWAQHLIGLWVGKAITSSPPHCRDSGLHSYIGFWYQTDGHIMIHEHLFGGPGKIQTHSSLTRISFKCSKNPCWCSMQTPFLFPSTVDFVHLKAACSFLVVLPLGWARGLRQLCCCVSFWFWWEIGFGFTYYLCT
jgi:hypothetical protein